MKNKCCFLKCKLVNDKESNWNGCIIQNGSQQFVVTTLATIILSLPCKHLKHCFEANFTNLGSIFLSTAVYVQVSKYSHCLQQFDANFTVAWKSDKFSQILKKIKFSSGIIDKHNNASHEKICCKLHYEDELLSWFVLFAIKQDNNLPVSFSLPESQVALEQGMSVWTNSFPFGESDQAVFHNCVSKGILCNIIDNIFLLIDACCLPGSQGACVLDKNFNLLGIIVCPLVLKTGQVAGMTILCSWDEVCRSLSAYRSFSNNSKSAVVYNSTSNILQNPSEQIEVVSLRHHLGWGSGVVIVLDTTNNKILIATCRHVVEASSINNLLQATFFSISHKPITFPAKVVYMTKSNTWLDFALLEVTCGNSLISALSEKMSKYLTQQRGKLILKYSSDYSKGTSVFAKGHCVFDSSSIKPTVTNGQISSVVYYHDAKLQNKTGLPVLLHSNCVVLDGASGGGIFSTQNWTFYGLIVNNVKEFFDEKKHILFPNVNFVLPANLFMPAVMSHELQYCEFSFLDKFAADSSVERHWLLGHENKAPTSFSSKL